MLIDPTEAVVLAEPVGSGPGNWIGAPSVVLDGPDSYIAYRVRVPATETGPMDRISIAPRAGTDVPIVAVDQGRGTGNVVAKFYADRHPEGVCYLDKSDFAAESLERPCLIRLEDGRWRIYVSCATPGTKHWKVVMLEADSPDEFDVAKQQIVLPGSDQIAVKDPVILRENGLWHLWASCHPLDVAGEEDRMTVDYATSEDGIEWAWQGTAMSGRPGFWDERGVRPASVVKLDEGTAPVYVMFYDGRASAEENFDERIGIAVGTSPDSFTQVGDQPLIYSPFGKGGLRYLDAVRINQDEFRLVYECTRPDGAHDLRTQILSVDHLRSVLG